MNAIISYSASVTIDGELREVSGGGNVDAKFVTTGVQTVGNTYEVLGANVVPGTAMFVYNKGTVDVSIRVAFPGGKYSTNQYNMFTVPPGAIFCVPRLFITDDLQVTQLGAIFARSASGTCEVDYCVIV